jgi:hypothetical protein
LQLESGLIGLSQPRAFNDPFELNPHFGLIAPKQANSPEQHEYFFSNDGLKNAFALKKTEPIVVLSLSELRDSLLMWAHYAASHRGFAIGFDSDQPILSGSSPHRRVEAVKYTDARPSKPTWDELSDTELLLTKGLDWAYEKEWRILDSLYSADGDAWDPAETCWPFRIRPQAVAEVIVGWAATRTLRERLGSVLSRPEFRHVIYLRAELDARRYGLEFIAARPAT